MFSHILVGGVDVRIVETGFTDAALEIVRDHDLDNATQEAEGTLV